MALMEQLNLFLILLIKKNYCLRFDKVCYYKIYSKIYSTKEIVINFKKKIDKPEIDYNQIIIKIQKLKPDLLLIANPNSPTGTIINKKKMLGLIRTANKNKCKILLDEAYYPYSKKTLINEINNYKNLIVVRSLKAFGLSGLRVGYLVSNKNFVEKVSSYRPLYEINSIGAFLFLELLKNYTKVKKSISNLLLARNYFIKELNKRNIKFLKSFVILHIKIEKNRDKILNFISKKIYIRKMKNIPL